MLEPNYSVRGRKRSCFGWEKKKKNVAPVVTGLAAFSL